MARAIDVDVAIKRFRGWLEEPHEATVYNLGFDDAIWRVLDVIEHLPTLTQPNEWVSVEKRLPEDDAPAGRKQITVMVTTKAGKVTIASRVFEPERDYCGKVYPARWLWSRWLNNHVTHWMELPAPPGKDNNVPTKAQNEPLTWEELKEMAGEPVYIVEPKKSISSWMLIDEVDEKSMWCVVGMGSCYRNFYKTYGKTWLAYRRPPEGEEETE